MSLRLAELALALLWAAQAGAVMPPKHAREKAARFARLSQTAQPTASDALVDTAVRRYNRKPGHDRRPERAAAAFLSDSRDLLGADPADLAPLRRLSGVNHHHILYQQTYKGLPVEFSRVKVHLDDAGNVTGARSTYRPRLDLDARPSIAASVAAYAVKRDAGHEPRSRGQLVVLPDPQTGEAHLAWKFTVNGAGLWRYYVDAHSGEILLRYDDRRYACTCGGATPTCGTIRGEVFPLDDRTPAQLKRFRNETVYIGGAATHVVTDVNGYFCSPATGKIFTQLQGPYVNIANFRGASASYDNSLGVWSTVATPLSSPHPYPNNANILTSIDITGLAGTANAVKFMPVFTNFDVGLFDDGASGEGGGDIIDDDQVAVIDGDGNVVGSYVGARGSFNGATIVGKKGQLRLKTNESGTGPGYDVTVSSFLVLNSPNTLGTAAPNANDNDSGSFDWWPASYNALGLRGEFNLFYHLNEMREYFAGGPDAGGQASLNKPATAMAFAGPNLQNAFYDPDYDMLFFGDNNSLGPSDSFMSDATVSHHEYTHYVVEKLFPIQNFGQAGAMSEGLADYFSGSSLNQPRIGVGVLSSLGIPGGQALRELDCSANPPCYVLGGNRIWVGEIHDDSIFLSQALWDFRKDGAVGQTCADNAIFQALLFFPESFVELRDAMVRVINSGAAAGCGAGAAGAAGTAFANHGIPMGAGTNDPYDTAARHNDGFEQAIDISTLTSVSGTIFPTADIDFFTFSAGPGLVKLKVALPAEGFFYKGYTMTVFDRQHKELMQVSPPFDGVNTDSGFCTEPDCNTTQSSLSAEFYNSGQNQYFVELSGGPTATGNSNSGVKSSTPYVLTAQFARLGAVSGSIVTAKVDGDVISFSLPVTSFTQTQDYNFSHAQLLDHRQQVLASTRLHVPALPGDYLLFVSSRNAFGTMSGQVKLAPGFNARFPSIGTVALEVFGYNVQNSTISLGVSNLLYLTTTQSDAKAYNNVINPARGDKSTVRFDVQSGGRVTVKLYTLSGSLVSTIFDEVVPAGKGAADWDGRNVSGATVASGVYIVHIQGPGLSKTQKIAVIK